MRFKLTKNNIIKYNQVLKKRLNYIQKNILDEIFNQLQINSPVRTGYLKSRYILNEDQITNDTPYIWYVNNGTKYQSGQHFIQRSIMIGLMQLNKNIINASNKNN